MNEDSQVLEYQVLSGDDSGREDLLQIYSNFWLSQDCRNEIEEFDGVTSVNPVERYCEVKLRGNLYDTRELHSKIRSCIKKHHPDAQDKDAPGLWIAFAAAGLGLLVGILLI